MKRNFRQNILLVWLRGKRALEFIFFWLFDSLALFASPRGGEGAGRVALVFIKLLGDYALWFPYARVQEQFFRRQGKSVVFVVSSAIEPLVLSHFPGSACLSIQPRRFVGELKYRWRMLRFLRAQNVALTIHDFAPRDGICSDAAVRALSARVCVGFDLANADRVWVDRSISRHLYTNFLPITLAAHRTAQHALTARFLGIDDKDIRAAPAMATRELRLAGVAKYVLVAPGASVAERRWPAARFSAVVRSLLKNWPAYQCMIVGGPDERELCERVAREAGPGATSLAGQTSLSDLPRLVAQACFVLTNDSAVGHIAANIGVPALSIVGGGHFGRCFPYPPHSAVPCPPRVVVHEMPCFGCDWLCRWSVAADGAYPCLAAISEGDVLKELACLVARINQE